MTAKTGRKWLRALITIGLALTGAVLAAQWLHFRMTHVIAGYAFVKADIVPIGAPVAGQVLTVEVQPGQRIKAGDVLVRFNSRVEEAAIAEAKALLATEEQKVLAEKELAKVQKQRVAVMQTRLATNVRASESERAAFQVQLEHADKVAKRAKELSDQSLFPVAEQEAAQMQASLLQQQRDKAAFVALRARADLEKGTVEQQALSARDSRVVVSESRVAAARATLALAETKLEMTIVRAPKDGQVSRRLVEPGAAVRVGAPLIEFWIDNTLSVEAWIDEDDLGKLKPGAAAHVVFTEFGELMIPGRIESIGFVTDAEVRSISVTVPVANRLARARWVRAHIMLDRDEPRLLPGLTANVSIPL